MKKTLSVLVILSLLLTQKTNAQLEKGNVLVGADLANFNIGLDEGGKTSISLTPKAAWFIKDNMAIGPYVGFGFTSQKVSGETATTTTYGVGLFGRYYASKEETKDINFLKHGRWFGEVNAGIGGENTKGGNSTNGLALGFGPGYAYFITQSVAFETLLKWNPTIGFGNEPFKSNLTLNFGFQIYLPGKATMNKVKSQEGIK